MTQAMRINQQARRAGRRVSMAPSAGLIGAALLIGVAGCGGDAQVASTLPRVWAVGASEVVQAGDSPRDETSCFDREDRRIRLSGAVNETVAFEFVLTATDHYSSGLEIDVEDWVSPAGTIPRDAVRIYRHQSIAIDRYPNWYLRSIGPRVPREIPDALVPISASQYGQPFTIAPGESLALWVEIRVPRDARPGAYEGALVVREPGGQRRRIPVSLSVRDIFLSPEDAIPVLAGVQIAPIVAAHTRLDPENLRQILSDPAGRRVLYETFALLQEHGLSPLTDEVRPGFSQDIDGTIHLDWEDYESFCGPLIDGTAYADGRGAARWPLPVDGFLPDPSQYGGLGTITYTAVLKKTLESAAAHFEEKEWLDRAYVFIDYPGRDNPSRAELEQVRALANLTHLAHARLRFASRLIPQPMSPFGWFDHVHADLTRVVDIWSTPARYQHRSTLSRLQTLGKETWLWPDRPPFSGSVALEAPPIHARSLAWQAFLYGHDAIWLDRVTQWPQGGFDEPIRERRQRSDTWLVYPGTLFGLSRPVPSVRLKQLQLGLQDGQKLRLLARHDRAATARLIAGSLIKAAGTAAYGDHYQDGLFGRRVDDPAIWEMGAALVNDELESALRDDPEGGDEAGANRSDWARFLSATRTIEAWVESSRLRLDDRPSKGRCRMSHDVAIRSELRTPLSGTLAFGPLPEGAAGVSDLIRVGPVPEMGLARKRLIARYPALPEIDLDGHGHQRIDFDAGSSGHVEMTATYAVVLAPQAPQPIAVDGSLEDWLPAASNAAGDFRLITAGSRRGRERAAAKNQTIAYFMRREGVLYIGIHAAVSRADEGGGSPVGPFRNDVIYEDLMPVGEDLVEILIDPTNTGTQSGDLYHVVVKSTGNPRFERGVETTPPIGEVGPWPGDPPSCCVVRTAQGWSAELGIPISTFGPAAANRVWGINLARLDPAHGEYSDWARAPRYCYDPRTLGNLVWPD